MYKLTNTFIYTSPCIHIDVISVIVKNEYLVDRWDESLNVKVILVIVSPLC